MGIAGVLLVFLIGVGTSHAHGLGTEADWVEGGAGGSGWYEDPATGNWTNIPAELPDSNIGYRYEILCFDDDVGSIDCFAELGFSCDEADGGTAVQWFSGLKIADPATWLRYGAPTCVYSEQPIDLEEQIRAVILSEFQQRPIAAGELVIQPGPHFLVGMHTNMFVDAREQIFDMTLLGQNLRIVATPTEYEWNYGDGSSYGPSPAPGGPLPEERWGEPTQTSHVYTASGDYQVSVTTYFSGEYSVNGGPMISIDGRAQVASPPQLLSIWRSESRNVADNCLVNPAGFGC